MCVCMCCCCFLCARACVCVCMCLSYTHTHTHTHTIYYIYIFIYIEGFRPEWCISTIYHALDTPFWSGTLDIYIYTYMKVDLVISTFFLSLTVDSHSGRLCILKKKFQNNSYSEQSIWWWCVYLRLCILNKDNTFTYLEQSTWWRLWKQLYMWLCTRVCVGGRGEERERREKVS